MATTLAVAVAVAVAAATIAAVRKNFLLFPFCRVVLKYLLKRTSLSGSVKAVNSKGDALLDPPPTTG